MFSMPNRRPDWYRQPATLQTSSHREDQQPNETLTKRHSIAPPTLLSTSVPNPQGYRGQGMDNSWRGKGRNGRGGWTQVAKRGGKRGHGSGSRDKWRQNNTDQPHPTPDSTRSSADSSLLPESRTKPPVAKRSNLPLEEVLFQKHAPGSSRYPNTPTVEPIKLKPPLYMRRPQGTPFPVPKFLHTPSPPLVVDLPRSVTSSKSQTPPFKRRKVDHNPDFQHSIKTEETGSDELSIVRLSPIPPIKHEERTPTPPVPPGRRLVTESCSFFPLPENCHKSHPDYKQNRHALFIQEYSFIKSRGLKKTKVLFRDDGMVIEWTSSTPVWSDTLRPEPSNLPLMMEAAFRANSKSAAAKPKSTTSRRSESCGDNEDQDSGVSNSLSPSRPPSPPQIPAQGPTFPSTLPLPRRRPLPLPSPRPNSALGPSPPLKIPITPNHAEADNSRRSQVPQFPRGDVHRRPWTAEELAEVEPLAIGYLQRFINLFDTDRSQLRGGYSDNAILSVRVSRSVEAIQAEGTLYQSDLRFVQGPGPISGALASLGPYKFCHRGVAAKILYDAVLLNSESGGGILLTVHGEVASEPRDTNPHPHHTKPDLFSVTQSLILQKSRSMDRMELWPLQATSHQLVLRQVDGTGPGLLSMTETMSPEDMFPWLR